MYGLMVSFLLKCYLCTIILAIQLNFVSASSSCTFSSQSSNRSSNTQIIGHNWWLNRKNTSGNPKPPHSVKDTSSFPQARHPRRHSLLLQRHGGIKCDVSDDSNLMTNQGNTNSIEEERVALTNFNDGTDNNIITDGDDILFASSHSENNQLYQNTHTTGITQIKQSRRFRSRFLFQPILTLTLKDPFAKAIQYEQLQHQQQFDNANDGPTFLDADDAASSSSPNKQLSSKIRNYFWSHRSSNQSSYTNIFNLNSLSPIMLYSIRSKSKPLPNYIPSLHYTSLTTGYKYDDIRDRPSFIEGELKFRKILSRMMFLGGRKTQTENGMDGGGDVTTSSNVHFSGRQPIIELDVGPRYSFKDKKMAVVVRIGGESGLSSSGVSGHGSGTTSDSFSDKAADGTNSPSAMTSRKEGSINNIVNGRIGCYAMARFAIIKGKKYLEYIRGSYKMNLPFTAVGSISITPSYDFGKEEPTCNIIGKSSSGRTAAVIDLNWENPTLSVVHALDERNTISPEISLYDAKILYNWSVALDSGHIKTRIDPSSAVQVTWTDQSLSGKWVTDFKLPLVGNPGPLAGDIRVRRQFEF